MPVEYVLLTSLMFCMFNNYLVSGTRSGRAVNTGYMRTDVLLYGEEHPHSLAVAQCFRKDVAECPDALIVIGTSLNSSESSSLVQAISLLVQAVRKTSMGITLFVNRVPPPSGSTQFFDYHLGGNLEDWSGLILHQVWFISIHLNLN
jgi:NAD-dependent SIR2 family protein deacetylase